MPLFARSPELIIITVAARSSKSGFAHVLVGVLNELQARMPEASYKKMLDFTNTLNKAVSGFFFKGNPVYREVFGEVLDELQLKNLARLGSVKHMATFTCQMLNFVIVTSMHFYAIDVNYELENRKSPPQIRKVIFRSHFFPVSDQA